MATTFFPFYLPLHLQPLIPGFAFSSTMFNSNLNSPGAFSSHFPFSVSASAFSGTASLEASNMASKFHRRNPRLKRSKMMRTVDRPAAGSGSSSFLEQKYPKKPEPCSECGKEFWSWKALFGHMRCHPERQWRGINPPLNLRPQNIHPCRDLDSMTDEDKEVAASLLQLATSPTAIDGQIRSFTSTNNEEFYPSNTSAEEKTAVAFSPVGNMRSICRRGSSSGLALGRHKKYYRENCEDPPLMSPFVSSSAKEGCGNLDLNLLPPLEDAYSVSPSSGINLDLRLGL